MKEPINIKMKFFECANEPLYNLMQNHKSTEFSEEFIVLYNFAVDLKYADYIQEDLLEYLLPYYHTAIKEYFNNNHDAMTIIEQFNDVFFRNKDRFLEAMSPKSYRQLMDVYIECLFEKMESCGFESLDWVIFFNTIIFFDIKNIKIIFNKIWNDSSDNVKLTFFLYLSIFFFSKEDNIFSEKIEFYYHDYYIGGFDNFADDYFWDEDTANCFKIEITNPEMMNKFLQEMESLLPSVMDASDIKSVLEKMRKHFYTIYIARMDEYLYKMFSYIKDDSKKKPIKILMYLIECDEEYLLYDLMQNYESTRFNYRFGILNDFARDLKYADYIQEDLLEYLLPYYHTTIREYSKHKNWKEKFDPGNILEQFNDAFFKNRDRLLAAISPNSYRQLMDVYIECLFQKMEDCGFESLNWIELFNTSIFLDNENIKIILDKIWNDSTDNIKLAFLQYLSILFFEEKDNIFSGKLTDVRHGNSMLEDCLYYDISFAESFYWTNDTIEYFKKEMTNPEIINKFLDETKRPLLAKINIEDIELVFGEMRENFNTVYKNRINEYLDEMKL